MGVDIFLAFNQSSDKKCYEASLLDDSDPDYYTCSEAYRAVSGFLLDAACKVSWPSNPFILWPPGFDGGSWVGQQFDGG